VPRAPPSSMTSSGRTPTRCSTSPPATTCPMPSPPAARSTPGATTATTSWAWAIWTPVSRP